MSSPKKIILTRPIAQAQPLARRLTELGYSVALFPLLQIAPVSDKTGLHDTLADLSRYSLAVFVSPNAIHAVFQNGLAWPRNVAIAVMGEGSRIALAQYGIDEKNNHIYCPADPFHSDSEALLQQLDLLELKGRRVVIFRAESGRELLSEALAAHDIHVDKVVSYRRFAPVLSTEKGQQLLSLLATTNDWVVSSSEALKTLVEMVENVAGEGAVVGLQHINLLVSHHRIVETAEKCGFKRISLIGSGDENLLLALQSHL